MFIRKIGIVHIERTLVMLLSVGFYVSQFCNKFPIEIKKEKMGLHSQSENAQEETALLHHFRFSVSAIMATPNPSITMTTITPAANHRFFLFFDPERFSQIGRSGQNGVAVASKNFCLC